MERAISPNEVKLVDWLLDHALIDVTAYRLHSVQELRVVGGCTCGCSSLYFEPERQRGNVQMLADELAVYPDGQQAGVILWGREGKSSGWKCTIASRSRPTGFRMSPIYALGMIWDVGIWNVATDPIDQQSGLAFANKPTSFIARMAHSSASWLERSLSSYLPLPTQTELCPSGVFSALHFQFSGHRHKPALTGFR